MVPRPSATSPRSSPPHSVVHFSLQKSHFGSLAEAEMSLFQFIFFIIEFQGATTPVTDLPPQE